MTLIALSLSTLISPFHFPVFSARRLQPADPSEPLILPAGGGGSGLRRYLRKPRSRNQSAKPIGFLVDRLQHHLRQEIEDPPPGAVLQSCEGSGSRRPLWLDIPSARRLLGVEHVEKNGKRLMYLVFEYLDTDLKKYVDSYKKGPNSRPLPSRLIQVRLFF
ncbi:hypothetical protein KSP39_PZI023229 [Platanthera zijinensis]|uniref:Uncharacterized protein n=1 Tax=Platanthera zijinensis TaxID=2320716 RepID=A0AAP0AVV0_9ASPA